MKLLRLTATFGCLSGDTLTFGAGLTLMGAPNGGGKSTWCAFLRTMLYGLDTRQRDRKGVPADKNRYRPWNGAPMEGLLVCEYQGQVLELRRTSADGVPMGTFSARYQDSNLPVPGLTGENAGEFLTGISREVFDRSVFLRQTGLAVSQSQELEKRISSLVSSGEEDVSFTEANNQLKTWLHRRRFHKSGLLPQLEEEAEQLRQRLSQTTTLRQELGQCQSRAEALRQQKAQWEEHFALEYDKVQRANQHRCVEASAQLDAAEQQLQTLLARQEVLTREVPDQLTEQLRDHQQNLSRRRRKMTGAFVIVLLLSLCAAVFFGVSFVPSFPLQLSPFFLVLSVIVLWVLFLLAVLFTGTCNRRDRQEIQSLRTHLETHRQEEAALVQEISQVQLQRDRIKEYYAAVLQQSGGPSQSPEAERCLASLHHTEQEIAQLQGQLTALGDPVLLDARLDELQETTAKLQGDYDALEIAMDALQEADNHLHARFSPQLSQRAGMYFHRLTLGRFSHLSLDRAFQATVREGASLADRPLALLSQGTADQLYLALRLAVAELVLPDPQACPLVLDDALLAFDDSRLAVALEVLTQLAQTRQVFLFTCQHRELALLQGRSDVSVVTLPGF